MDRYRYSCIWTDTDTVSYGQKQIQFYMDRYRYSFIWIDTDTVAYGQIQIHLHMERYRYSYTWADRKLFKNVLAALAVL
jgi:hypothetical protein